MSRQRRTVSKEEFEKWSMLRRQLSLPLKIDESLEFQESMIRNDSRRTKTFLGGACVGKRRHNVDVEFMNAFSNMSKDEQTEYYVNIMQHVAAECKGTPSVSSAQPELPQDTYLITVQVRQGTFKSSWVDYKVQLMVSECKVRYPHHEHSLIDLHQYLIRRSKATDRFSFVLESIRPSRKQCIRIGFESQMEFDFAYNLVKIVSNKAQRENVTSHMALSKEGRSFMSRAASPNRTNLQVPTGVPQPSRAFKDNGNNNMEELVLDSPIPATHQISPIDNNNNNNMKGSKVSNRRMSIHDKTIVEQLLVEQRPDTLQRNENQNQVHRRMSVQSRQNESDSDSDGDQQEILRKQNLDIFHRLLPDYQLEQFADMSRFRLLQYSGNQTHKLYQGSANPHIYKVSLEVLGSEKDLLSVIVDVASYKLWNHEVELGDIKVRITSENSAIVYQKHMSYSKLYRPRDYLYVRHVFSDNGCVYVADRSIDNFNFPPHTKIIRGVIQYAVWGIRRLPQAGNKCLVSLEIQFDHGGYLTKEQQHFLSLRYLQGVTGLERYMATFHKTSVRLEDYFIMDWDIQKNESNVFEQQARKLKKLSKKNAAAVEPHIDDFGSCVISEIADEESFHTAHGTIDWTGCGDVQLKNLEIVDFEEEKGRPEIAEVQPHQILEEKNFEVQLEVNCELNSEGHVLLPKAYLNKKHKMYALSTSPYIPVKGPNGLHHYWKDEWQILPEGALTFIHQKKTEEQKKVLQYVIKKLGKNLLSGKGVLNVSLPVDIFGTQSNLQRVSKSMGLGPKYLEAATKTKDPVQRIKNVMVFGLGNGLACIDMQKPFNPILGQTYQGWLNGCPIFCEQISHHPPIVGFYFEGRGYKVYGSMESRVELNINSGCGINFGEYVVQFQDNKQKVRFRTPGGELSGLTYGQRKFNFRGKGFYHDEENCMYGQMVFNPYKKWFGRQQKPADCVQGRILKVTPEFIANFKKMAEKQGPKQKQTLQVLSTLTGRWTKNLEFDGKQYYNIDKDLPCQIEQELFPLNSNSNYREDIIYRKKLDFARAQIEKERLENFQRADRKLREKRHGKSH